MAAVTLAEARRKAQDWRAQLAKSIDPLDERRAAKAAEAGRKMFGQCAAELIASKSAEWRNAAHRQQWESLQQHCAPLWDRPVDEIDTPAVLSVLTPLWARIPVTAQRVRGRIEAVLDFAKAHKLRSGENPAAWRGHLALILPKRPKIEKAHLAAMPYQDVPAFIAELRTKETVAALALEFCILTAARTGEVRLAKWDEIDTEAGVWVIPPHRMKASKEHRIPLSGRAVEILEMLAAHRHSGFVFPGRRRGQSIGSTAMLDYAPSGVTVHGFRSAFRDWCGNETHFPRELAEQALAHSVGNEVERSYRRGDALEKRRALMQAWAAFCEPSAGGNVVPMRA